MQQVGGLLGMRGHLLQEASCCPSHTDPESFVMSFCYGSALLASSGWEVFVLPGHTLFAHVYLFKGSFGDDLWMRCSTEWVWTSDLTLDDHTWKHRMEV